jgi:uncharacterized delta-60 repeat protein
MLHKTFTTALLSAAFCFPLIANAADGQLDPTFGNGGIAYLSLDGVEGHELRTGAAIALPDGKLLFGGSRNRLIDGNPDPHMRASLARMNADGSADTGFGTDPANPGILVLDDLVPGTAMQQIESMQRFADGSIVAVGTAQAFGPLTCFVLKLDADGARDASFGSDGLVLVAAAYCHAVALDSQQRILVAGERQSSGQPAEGIVMRFGADGSFDPAFGNNGTAVLASTGDGESGYLQAIAIAADDRIVVGGFYEAYGAGLGGDFSLARFSADGTPDTSFAQTGWRVFHIDGDASMFNGIDRLLSLSDGGIVIAGYRQDEKGSVQSVLGRVLADGDTDSAFGDSATPGYVQFDVVADAWSRYASGLVAQDDGKLLLAISYATPGKSDFLLLRTSADGVLDASFGKGGSVDLDVAPDGNYSNLTALTMQDGHPILAGSAQRANGSSLVDLAVVRLTAAGAGDEIFKDGFEAAAASVSTYDDLDEGFLGTSFNYQGIAYHDANGIGGVFPDGSTFTPDDVGDQFIIEDAALFYADFPDFGSSPNALTFGNTFIPGTNFSIGAFVRASLDLAAPANAVSVDLAFYENGPWGGIQIHMDAYSNGVVVGSDSLTIADGGGRDNPTATTLAISGVAFDALKLYATYDGQPSAPRVMIDNLSLTPAP